ncbi:MAG: phosphopantetheine-binding protein [Anaeromyxobacter sp.]
MTLDLVRTYLLNEFFSGESKDALDPEQPLISSGLLDSVATLKLVLFLEKQFDIDVDSMDIVDGRLDTLNLIVELVQTKRSSAAKSS